MYRAARWPRVARRRAAWIAVAGVALLGGAVEGVHLWRYYAAHVSTDDAFIAAHISPVSARVPGTVAEVLVVDNQDVKAGDVLVRLDPRDYEVAVTQARAAVAAARGDLDNARVNVPLTDESTQSGEQQARALLASAEHAVEGSLQDLEQRRGALSAQRSAVAAAEAAVRAEAADVERTREDRDRAQRLLRTGLVAQQDFDHAHTAFESARALHDAGERRLDQAKSDIVRAEAAVRSQDATVAQARQRVTETRAGLANAHTQRSQVKMRVAQVEAAQAKLALAEANLRQAELNLSYATIRAPVGGRISRKTVEVGQVVPAGQQLLAVVDLDDVWVIANFKETQLSGVRAGQRATIEVDAHPGVVFRGRVDSIQAGSGAVFSLLPPENASGNFVKVVQRIPVKLVLEPGENRRRLLAPGMSVVPTIDVR